jgi:hypothetical protein
MEEVAAVGSAVGGFHQDLLDGRLDRECRPDGEQCDEDRQTLRVVHSQMIANALAARRSDTGMNAGAKLRCAIFVIVATVATSALANDGARISRLESEIQQLRTQIDAQNRRIRKLEAELGRRPGKAPAGPESPPAGSDEPASQPAPAGPQPWHAAAAWDRVAKGMTANEVTAILGAPTAAESVDALKTLFYRGPTAAGGNLSGMVNLREDRVVAVVKPAF